MSLIKIIEELSKEKDDAEKLATQYADETDVEQTEVHKRAMDDLKMLDYPEDKAQEIADEVVKLFRDKKS